MCIRGTVLDTTNAMICMSFFSQCIRMFFLLCEPFFSVPWCFPLMLLYNMSQSPLFHLEGPEWTPFKDQLHISFFASNHCWNDRSHFILLAIKHLALQVLFASLPWGGRQQLWRNISRSSWMAMKIASCYCVGYTSLEYMHFSLLYSFALTQKTHRYNHSSIQEVRHRHCTWLIYMVLCKLP